MTSLNIVIVDNTRVEHNVPACVLSPRLMGVGDSKYIVIERSDL